MPMNSSDVLKREIAKRLSNTDAEFTLRALEYATNAHEGQFRLSGCQYIEHPIQTALVLTRMNQDAVTIAGALLHDVLEDCAVTDDQLKAEFGEEVHKLVDAVTKLKKLAFHPDDAANGRGEKRKLSTESVQAYNLRKMFIAMAQDIRVVLIKLADRLHNMRTLKHLPPERQLAIARETMDIYAPIAHRLGIAVIKWQLEDEAFKYLMPAKYRSISRAVARKRKEREHYISKTKAVIDRAMKKAGIKCEVSGRAKHLYSINRKIERYKAMGRQVDEIYDLTALRIIVEQDKLEDCYHALEVIHGIWRPIPNQFDDYIANPKDNLYQSLHTAVMGPDHRPLEVQIRTAKMHREAEDGIAAHWAYKEGDRHSNKTDKLFERAVADLKKILIEDQKDVSGDAEYIKNVTTDFLSGQIFVFTPNGDVIELPRGATSLDFAYKIHTNLGHRCRGAKVNDRIVPLNHQLSNGDIVRIINSKTPQAPKLDWLNPHLGFLKTDSARSKVRAWFRRQERADSIKRGTAILDKERKQLDLKASREDLAAWVGYPTAEDLEFALGSGELPVEQFVERVVAKVFKPEIPEVLPPEPQKINLSDIVVMDFKGLYTRIPKCCAAVRYGEPIIGYMTRGRGVSIHKTNCPNQHRRTESDRWVAANWGHTKQAFPTTLYMKAKNRVGLIRDITTIVAEENANIGMLYSDTDAGPEKAESSVTVTIYTSGAKHLARIFNRLKTVSGMRKVAKSDENGAQMDGVMQVNLIEKKQEQHNA